LFSKFTPFTVCFHLLLVPLVGPFFAQVFYH
jgi:hypothetical protein